MTEKEDDKKTLQCDYCRKQIRYGGDIISVEKCVLGPKGIIPLGEVFTFCTDTCVSKFFDHQPISDLPEVPRRIP